MSALSGDFGTKLYQLHSLFNLTMKGACDQLENCEGPHDDMIPAFIVLKEMFDELADEYSKLV